MRQHPHTPAADPSFIRWPPVASGTEGPWSTRQGSTAAQLWQPAALTTTAATARAALLPASGAPMLWAAAGLLTLAFAAGACSEEAAPEPKEVEDSAFVGFDTGGVDVGDAAQIEAEVEATSGCNGAVGCPCTTNAECDSAVCAIFPAGLRCAAPCGADDCGDLEVCAPILATEGDPMQVCVSTLATLCSPCKSDSECTAPGVVDARCVRRGSDGSFCGRGCVQDSDCPGGYACQDGVSVQGATVRQCVPSGDALCVCNGHAIAVQRQTPCEVKGAAGAACPGHRACLAAGLEGAPPGGGLTACLGKAPGPEACDSTDNDCDGQTDEGPAGCDDGDACTKDACQLAKCVTSADSGGCDDGNACTQGDTCVNVGGVATCQGGIVSCDDGDPCTSESCVGQKCQFAPLSEGACDDGNACTSADQCIGKGCAGLAKSCDDANICTADACDAATGACKATAMPGASCDDGDACTKGDACAVLSGDKGAACAAGKPSTCDDGNACTIDSCDPTKGCVSAADVGKSSPCYDGPPDTNGKGSCKSGSAACGADGQLGACLGQVLPQGELCGPTGPVDKGNGIDEDCDSVTDEGCGQVGPADPPKVRWRFASVHVRGAAGGAVWVSGAGSGLAATMTSGGAGAPSLGLGWYQSLRGLWK